MQTAERSILVTGGAGYIGAHACKALHRAGYLPIVYDNLVHGHMDFVKWGPFEYGDILDAEKINAVLKKYRPDAVIHFAALAYVGESVAYPEKYYRNNVSGSLTLFEAMRRNAISKIVFSSSCTIYGNSGNMPIAENHPLRSLNPYGNTKLAVEQMLGDYDTAYGIKSISLRYFNAAGADPSGEIGEDHDPETHLIPLVLRAAAEHAESVIVFGDDYETPDGTCVRDYVHVCDLADAHLQALQLLDTGKKSDCFNLGNGQGYSVMDVIKGVKQVTSRKVHFTIGDRRRGDPARLVSNSQKAKQILKWQPKFSDIEIIVQHAWDWYKKRFCIR